MLSGLKYGLDKLFVEKAPALRTRARTVRRSAGKKLAGILRLDGMGDLIIFLDALRGYRELFNKDDFEIVLLMEDWLSPLVRDCPFSDRIFLINTGRFKKNLLYRLEILSLLRDQGFDVFINACIFRERGYGDIMAFASGAKVRAGFQARLDQKRELKKESAFYTSLLPDPKWKVHELQRNEALIRELGHKSFKCKMPLIDWIDCGPRRDYFAIHPGASFAERRWPAERFAELARAVHERYGLAPAIVGSGKESWLARVIMQKEPSLPWIDHMGAMDISGLARALGQARFTIANDSGPMHLSLALGTPTFVLAAGGEFTAYPSYPEPGRDFNLIHCEDSSCFDCKWNCGKGLKKGQPAPCLAAISTGQATEKIIKTLG